MAKTSLKSSAIVAKKKPTPRSPKNWTSYRKSKSDHNLLMALKKNMLQHEQKFVDTNLTAAIYALAGTATITLLNGLVQGVDENARIGRQINLKSIFLRGNVSVAQTTTGQGALRTIILIDQEVPQVGGSGVVMSITDYLTADGLAFPANLNNRKRFKVLMDEVVPISGVASVGTGNPTSYQPYFYKKLDYTSEFGSGGGAGTIADFTKNAVYLITYAINLATTAPIVNMYARVRFTDGTG